MNLFFGHLRVFMLFLFATFVLFIDIISGCRLLKRMMFGLKGRQVIFNNCVKDVNKKNFFLSNFLKSCKKSIFEQKEIERQLFES